MALLTIFHFGFLSRVLLCLSASIALFGPLSSIAYSDGTVIDICQIIPALMLPKLLMVK